MAKRGKKNFSFLLGIDKPVGVSSHYVVNCVRKALGEGRVGHMGTLDPLASGVMLIGVGSANRLNQFLASEKKTYEAVARFGASTNTYDSEGQIVDCCEPDSKLMDKKFALKVMTDLIGEHEQTPPTYSAIKIKGKAAYKYARANQDVEIPKRKFEIYKAELISIQDKKWDEVYRFLEAENQTNTEIDTNNLPSKLVDWKFSVEVSGGTYIRSLVHDLGAKLGCPAHVSFLRRTSVDCVSVYDCIEMEEIKQMGLKFTPDRLANSLPKIDVSRLLKFSIYEVEDTTLAKIKNGQALNLLEYTDDPEIINIKDSKILLTHKNNALAIYQIDTQGGADLPKEKMFAKPVMVFNGGVELGTKLQYSLQDSVCTFGVFDGVHKGHRYQIDSAISSAKSKGVNSAIITFDVDPDEIFVENFCKLMSNDERIAALKNSGADYVEIIKFWEVKDEEPKEFLDKFFGCGNTPCELHVGNNFHFGKNAAGNTDTLIEWGKKNGMEVIVHDLLTKNGITISSTNIRKGLL